MVEFICLMCKYQTEVKGNYNRHLNSTKHLRNKVIYDGNSKKTQQDSKKTQKDSKKTKKDSISSEKSLNSSTNTQKGYNCKYCGKNYSRRNNLKRHISKFCKKWTNEKDQTSVLKFMSQQIEEGVKKIAEMKKQHALEIETLLNKVGNTNNIENQQINIHINSYGKENLDYIKGDFLTNLLKIPYGAVPKLIEHVHFNPEHPENSNVKITNKKLPYASVFTEDKWEVRDKKRVIEDIIDKSYNMIDGEFTLDAPTLTSNQKKRYKDFQKKYDTEEKSLKRDLNKETELLILNSTTKLNENKKGNDKRRR